MKKKETKNKPEKSFARRTWMLITMVVVVFTGYFIVRNLIATLDYRLRIRELRQERAEYLRRIAADSALIEQLKDDHFLERYARERYHMQRTDEDVYIVR